jgi:non-specific serine/threonine protein kinase
MRGHEPGPISASGLPPGGLVGRAAESAAIQRMAGRARLVTITGLPGVGKTAVAVAAAAAMSANFADGAWLVGLDSLRDGNLLPHTIADALDLPDRLTRSRLDGLVDELRARRLLLVLDTCEHLAGDSAALAARLLQHPSADVRILATSRESLRVPGGLTVTIRPLRLPHAVTMFGQRAAEADPGFQITPKNRETVEAICQRLGQLPLAIDLAARQLAVRSLEELQSRLRADYWFLRKSEASPARHETLRTAIGWSHQLCPPAERLLWARLSVLGGSFELQDALDICADRHLPGQVVASAVTMLAARSVLLMNSESRRPARFRLALPLRAYGADMLRALGDDAEWQRRYQAWLHARRGGARED